LQGNERVGVRMPAQHDPQHIAYQKAPEAPTPLVLCL
jgi:hypothetical protein